MDEIRWAPMSTPLTLRQLLAAALDATATRAGDRVLTERERFGRAAIMGFVSELAESHGVSADQFAEEVEDWFAGQAD